MVNYVPFDLVILAFSRMTTTIMMMTMINDKEITQSQQLTSHDAVGEYQDVDIRWKLTDGKKQAGNDAADNADDTTSKPVCQRTDERTCDIPSG